MSVKKIKHCLRRETKANMKLCINAFRDIAIYVDVYV